MTIGATTPFDGLRGRDYTIETLSNGKHLARRRSTRKSTSLLQVTRSKVRTATSFTRMMHACVVCTHDAAMNCDSLGMDIMAA